MTHNLIQYASTNKRKEIIKPSYLPFQLKYDTSKKVPSIDMKERKKERKKRKKVSVFSSSASALSLKTCLF